MSDEDLAKMATEARRILKSSPYVATPIVAKPTMEVWEAVQNSWSLRRTLKKKYNGPRVLGFGLDVVRESVDNVSRSLSLCRTGAPMSLRPG